MRRTFLGVLLLVVLGCGGAPLAGTAPSSGPVSPASPKVVGSFTASDYVIQGAGLEGLFGSDGRRLGPWGGSWGIKDIYIADASKPSFFLLSDDGIVRAAVKEGDVFQVREVMKGKVLRPIGRVALVQREATTDVVDVDGKVLIEGVVPVSVPAHVANISDPPLGWPEYWWAPAWYEHPAALCRVDPEGKAAPNRCGWVTGTGIWLRGEDSEYAGPFLTGWAEARGKGKRDLWVDLSGQAFADVQDGWTIGPPSEGVAIAEGPEGTFVITADGTTRQVQAKVAHEVDSRACDPDSMCAPRFHEERAPVWVSAGTVVSSGYLGPDATLVVPAQPCPTTHPSGPFSEGRAIHCRPDGYHLIDPSGRSIAGPWPDWAGEPSSESPQDYPSGLFFSDGLAAVPVAGGWGYVDREGTLVLPGPYEVARPFRVGLAAVKQGGTVQYIRKDGKMAFGP